MLQEAKAKFFDLQRVIEQKQGEINHLIECRTNLVREIEKREMEDQSIGARKQTATECGCDAERCDELDPITA